MIAGGAQAAWRLGAALLLSLLVHLLLFLCWLPGHWRPADGLPGEPGGYALQVAFRVTADAAAAPAVVAEALATATTPATTEATPAPLSENGRQALPAIDAPRYFSLHELDVPPYALGELPDDPPELQSYNQAGQLTLELWIDARGTVMRVERMASNLPDVFFQQAQSAFLAMPFVPAQKEGQAVAARIRIALEFQKRYASQTVH